MNGWLVALIAVISAVGGVAFGCFCVFYYFASGQFITDLTVPKSMQKEYKKLEKERLKRERSAQN